MVGSGGNLGGVKVRSEDVYGSNTLYEIFTELILKNHLKPENTK